MQNKIRVSVVVCTFNGEKTIVQTLESLAKQSYPKNNYEIIVVDDGSTDNTRKLVTALPVKLIIHGVNKGISSARNSGLDLARGEIVAYIDDDCVARSDWLSKLIEPYKSKEIMAVGGIVNSSSHRTLTQDYLTCMRYGNPAELKYDNSRSLAYRFLIYFFSMYSNNSETNRSYEVREIYTANASFRTGFIKKVGGFNKELRTSEDSMLCTRLSSVYTNKKIICNPMAIVTTTYTNSLVVLVQKTYFRSEDVFKKYLLEKKIPPIFPFPLAIITITTIVAYFSLPLAFLTITLLPPIFYSWWVVRSLTNKHLKYMLFSYIQFFIEAVSLVGFITAFSKLKFKHE
ncbi:MAG: glycosyltransferase family 2 protein [Patescibacteria group bacterium]|jgi:glycosyltransferase involved in cell wall biosynthesis